ncbi:hypothetical protein D3C73_1466970 [compost metagenome]
MLGFSAAFCGGAGYEVSGFYFAQHSGSSIDVGTCADGRSGHQGAPCTYDCTSSHVDLADVD